MMGMDQVLLIDEDGGLFKLEPPDSNIQRLNENTIRLNRVSSSEWCFWSISSDFEIFLYVYERQAPIQAIVSIQDKVKDLKLDFRLLTIQVIFKSRSLLKVQTVYQALIGVGSTPTGFVLM